MQSYCVVFDVFVNFKILCFLSCVYLSVIIYYNGVSAWNKNTIKATYVRKTTYSGSVALNMCYLKPDQGPCRGNFPMYYFDADSKNCSTFKWGGCQGNGNRFDSSNECMRTCMTPPNPGKSRPLWCSLSYDYGYCFGAATRYYYDPLWKVCKKTIYSGCGGNKNNFYSLEQCEWVCRFGNGFLTVSTKKQNSGMKKILVINPVPTDARPCATENSSFVAGG